MGLLNFFNSTIKQSVIMADSDLIDYFLAVEQNGFILENSKKTAIETFKSSLRDAGILQKMKAVYLYVGSSTMVEYNLIDASIYPLLFSDGITRTVNGVGSNNAQGVTGIPLTALSPNNYSLGYFSIEDYYSVYETMGTDASEEFYATFNGGTIYGYSMGLNGITISASSSEIKGFTCLNSRPSEGVSIARNGITISGAVVQSGWRGNQMYIPYRREENRNYSLSFVGESLTEDELLHMNTAIIFLMTGLDRAL